MSDIYYYGSKVLREIAEPITEFDADFATECEKLINFMYEYDGVGLAAPQIGISKRFFAIDISKEGDSPMILANPEFIWKSEELETDSEGCLSIPGIRGMVERPVSVSVKAQDMDGNEVLIEKADGLFARALQHENDHLDGTMFVDHLTPVKKQLIANKLKKMAKQNRDV